MKGFKPERTLCPIRLPKTQYDQIKLKVVEDKVSFQKLVEVLLDAYLKRNKHVVELVLKHSDEKHAKKRRYELDSLEATELLRLIEEEHSPLRYIEKASEEVKKE